MKKIVSIGRVKNEADIIESFVRYALTHSDNIMIYDDDSSDNTVEILYKLKDEFKESIIIIQKGKNDIELGQDDVNNSLVNYAIDQLSADVIIPLDADEFLISSDKNNSVREVIENLPSTDCYTCNWRTYVCKGMDQNSHEYIPYRYKYYRNPELIPELKKVIIHKDAWVQYSLSLLIGNHNVFDTENNYLSIDINELLFAHYPLRSKEHAVSKIVKNYIKDTVDFRCTLGWDFHITKAYHQLKKNNFTMGDDEFFRFSTYYSAYPTNQLDDFDDTALYLYSNSHEIYPQISIKYEIRETDLFETIFQSFLSLGGTYKSGANQKYYLNKLLLCIDNFGRKYCYYRYYESIKKDRLIKSIYFKLVQNLTPLIININPKLRYMFSKIVKKIV